MPEESKKFGVKSYLHYFYEDCSGIGLCEVEQTAHHDLSKRYKSCRWLTCVGLCVAGFVLFLIGVVLLILGAVNSLSDLKTFVGGGMICVGGATLAICLAVIQIEVINRKQEILEQENFKNRCAQGISIHREKHSSPSNSETSTPLSCQPSPDQLPVTLYEISAVQPLLED